MLIFGLYSADLPFSSAATIFSVLNYGAKADGKTNDSNVHFLLIPFWILVFFFFFSFSFLVNVKPSKASIYKLLKIMYYVQAFSAAWKAACSATTQNPTVVVPSSRNFLVYPLIFYGPCKSSQISFQVTRKMYNAEYITLP